MASSGVSDGIVDKIFTAAQTNAKINKIQINSKNGNGYTALMLAVERDNLQVLRALLEAGAYLEISRSSGGSYTALSLAVDKGHTTAVRELLQHGAFLSCEKGIEALDMARENGFLDAVVSGEKKRLAQNQWDSGIEKDGVFVAFQHGRSDLVKDLVDLGSYIFLTHRFTYKPELLQMLLNKVIDVNFVFKESETFFKKSLQKTTNECVDIYNTTNSHTESSYRNNWTLLHFAVETQNIEQVAFLIKAGANVNAETSEGETPLNVAARNRNISAIRKLLNAGATVNTKDQFGVTPLAKILDYEIFEMCIEKEVESRSIYLSSKTAAEYVRNIKGIVMKGADVNVRIGKNQVPVLSMVVVLMNTDLVRYLIERVADVSTADINGNTALHYAIFMISQYEKSYKTELESTSEISCFKPADVLKILLSSFLDLNIRNKKSETPLLFAIKYNHNSAAAKILLKYTKNVNLSDIDQTTPLMFAVQRSFTDIIIQLLKQGADVNHRDKYDNTAVHYSAKTGNFEHFKMMALAGADIALPNKNNETPLILASRWLSQHFRNFHCNDTTDIVKYLISSNVNVNSKDKDGKTALHFAAYTAESRVGILVYPYDNYDTMSEDERLKELQKSSEIINLLLKHKADVNAPDSTKKTPLHYCVLSGKLEHVRLLVKAGGNVDFLDENQQTPLILAAKLQLDYFNEKNSIGSNPDADADDCIVWDLKGNQYFKATEIVNYLITSSADVNIADKDGNTALHFASQCNIETVTSLLNNSANIGHLNGNGQSVLHCAAETSATKNYCNIMDVLLKRLFPGQSEMSEENDSLDPPPVKRQKMNKDLCNIIDKQNNTGNTALIVALQNENEEIALKLLDYRADINICTENGFNALHFAVENGCLEAVKRIIKMGCDVNQQTKDGNTPLTLASDVDVVNALCAAGADINYVINGESVITNAIRHYRSGVIDQLINEGCNINSAVPDPPLISAISMNKKRIMNLLLMRGADVNIMSSTGIAPLMVASRLNSLGIISDLLENGADINKANEEGLTPLICCLQNLQNKNYYSGPKKDEILKSLPENFKNGFKVGPTTAFLEVEEWSSIQLSTETALQISPMQIDDLLYERIKLRLERLIQYEVERRESYSENFYRELPEDVLKAAFDFRNKKENLNDLKLQKMGPLFKACIGFINDCILFNANNFDVKHGPRYLILRSGIQFMVEDFKFLQSGNSNQTSAFKMSVEQFDGRLNSWKRDFSDTGDFEFFTYTAEELRRPKGIPTHHTWWFEKDL
ncbi:ankyrin-3-like [Physella acuta]|uniref:ankyrin-3-like n=1 Tax=Physella acuta TaxID=109671 RepID=UPI0027DBDBE5|nr:ankyrin-3-like [Physella acuta]